MKNKLTLWVAVLAILFMFSNYTQADDILSRDDQTVIQTIKDITPNTVTITGGGKVGSGFYIDPTHVYTNWHVVEPAMIEGKVWITTYLNQQVQGIIVSSNIDSDYAIIEVPPNPNVRTLEMSTQPEVGTTVIIIGDTLGVLPNTATKGMISGLDIPDKKKVRWMQLDATLNRGNSGSIIVDLQGKVVGIAQSITIEGQGVAFAVPIGDIR